MGAVIELSEFAIGLATGPNPAYLATVNADGAPQVTPVWIDYAEGHLLIDAAVGTLKLRNVQRDPRVAVSIAEHGNLYTKVDIRGEVVGYIEGERAIEQMDLLAQRYLGMDKNPWSVEGQERVIMKIAPVRVAEGVYDPGTGARSETGDAREARVGD
jgi:PPOX class probable F420-dependent enzyme